MTTANASATLTQEELPELLKEPIVTTAENETCDKCGIAVRAAFTASKGKQNLYFCAHHVREYESKLKSTGFTIFPEDTGYGVAKRQGL